MSGSAYDYIVNTGVIVADTASIQETVQTEWTGVFGTSLSTNDETPQGVIINGEVVSRQSVISNNAALANQINPNLSGGVFLDAICAMSGLEREADTFTNAGGVVLAGVQGSPVAAGSEINDADGNQFALVVSVTLDAVTGLATGQYVALNSGPVTMATGAQTIVSGVLGLETVTNPGTAVVLGTVTQSDEELRILRRITLAKQGVSLREAIQSSLNDLEGVAGCQTLENKTTAPVTIGGVTLVANSFWACVDGGLALDVGNALLDNKSMGCNWNGAQTIDITEPASGQVYAVQYDLPTLIPLVAKVSAKQGTYPGNPLVDIPIAAASFAANELPAIQGFVVGQSASAFELGAAIQEQCNGLYISSVQISQKSTIAYSSDEIPLLLFQKATLASTDVTVVLS